MMERVGKYLNRWDANGIKAVSIGDIEDNTSRNDIKEPQRVEHKTPPRTGWKYITNRRD